jgi:hypothetical protein
MVNLANEIHGFAGYYIDNTKQLVAYVKDSSSAFSAAATALSAHLATDGFGLPQRVRPKGVRIKQADYDFQTLSDYRDLVTDSIGFRQSGIVSVDLDEAINRVTIGVLASGFEGFRAQILTRAQAVGIPSAAINFVTGDYAKPAVGHVKSTGAMRRRLSGNNLEASHFDTLAGGEGIHDASSGSVCTAAVIADSGSAPTLVTASHCTHTMFQNDGDKLTMLGGDSIGFERNDPSGSQTCTTIPIFCWTHRSSDAVSFRLYTTDTSRVGVIARPSTRVYNVGIGGSRDTSISASNPLLYVTGTILASSLISGTEIDKIGTRSGWTAGTISATCQDISLAPPDTVKIYCTGAASNLGVRQGDSGGPVFIWDGYDGAVLAGTTEAEYGSSGSYWGGSESV